ncbi:MAG: diguanylate cyclase [Pseudomonadota bacterium]
MKVLIAEDDITSRTILTAILEKWGYNPIAVNDGLDALKILQKADSPELVLLDWKMPVMDGLEVCRRIRQQLCNNLVYIIILTSKSEKTNIVAGLDAGANDYVIKPYDNEELRARINVGQRMIEIQSELEKTKKALVHEAMHDHLTGIYNRRAIIDMLQRELSLARRKRNRINIGMCDLDNFKQINDCYGHQAGDEVLCGFTRTIQNNLRGYDIFGRYGGEEFLVIIPDGIKSSEEHIFERLRNKIAEQRILTRAGEISVTMSVGVAGIHNGESVDTLLGAADTALYRAKEEGRNQVFFA